MGSKTLFIILASAGCLSAGIAAFAVTWLAISAQKPTTPASAPSGNESVGSTANEDSGQKTNKAIPVVATRTPNPELLGGHARDSELHSLAELLSEEFMIDYWPNTRNAKLETINSQLDALTRSEHPGVRAIAVDYKKIHDPAIAALLASAEEGGGGADEIVLSELRKFENEVKIQSLFGDVREETRVKAALGLAGKVLQFQRELLWRGRFNALFNKVKQRMFRLRLLPYIVLSQQPPANRRLVEIRPGSYQLGPGVEQDTLQVVNLSGRDLSHCILDLEMEGYGGLSERTLYYIPSLDARNSKHISVYMSKQWLDTEPNTSRSLRVRMRCWTSQGREDAVQYAVFASTGKNVALSDEEWNRLDLEKISINKDIDSGRISDVLFRDAARKQPIKFRVSRKESFPQTVDFKLQNVAAGAPHSTFSGCLVLDDSLHYKFVLVEAPAGIFGVEDKPIILGKRPVTSWIMHNPSQSIYRFLGK